MNKPAPSPREFVLALLHSERLTIPQAFISHFGLTKAAFLAQLIALDWHFNMKNGKDDGWFYRTREELEERTGLSEDQQKRITKELREKRIIRVIPSGCPPVNHYLINYDVLLPLLFEELKTAPDSIPGKTPALKGEKSPGPYKGVAKATLSKEDSPLGGRGKEKTPSGSRGRDPRTDHPAIVAAHEVAGLYPPKAKGTADVWAQIIKAVGEDPDQDLLRRCREAWLARGHNPMNWAWALDWYPAGGPPVNGTASRSKAPAPDWKPTHPKELEGLARLVEILDRERPAVDAALGPALEMHRALGGRGSFLSDFERWIDAKFCRNDLKGDFLKKSGLRPGHLDPKGPTMQTFRKYVLHDNE